VHGVREAIAQLGPWHHDIEVAPGVWTGAVSEEIRGAEPLIAANLGKGSHRPVEHTVRLLRSVYPNGLEGRSVLDCACNAGGRLFGAVRVGAGSGLGFDARQHWIAQARFLSQHVPADGLDFEVLDLHDLPSRGVGQFDVCFFNGIFYHLPDPVAGVRIAADHTRELLILNTSTAAGRGRTLTLSHESDEALLSGVHGLAWLPTTAVLKPILEWCGFPHIHVVRQVAQAASSPRGWGRVLLVAARHASTLEDLKRELPTTQRSAGARQRLRDWLSR
jgi:tRNA (mo5U34)-methyltransferase